MQLEDAYPLSPLQQGMLFHALYAPHAGVDLMQIVVDLPEAVDGDALRGAWAAVAARHPMLRTRFRWEGVESPVQEVCTEAPVPWTGRDLSGLPPGDREEAVLAFLREDRRAGFDLRRAPLMRLALLRLAPAEHRMVWTIHHAAMDGRSSPVVLLEVFGLYDARGGEPPVLPPARPYREFIEWVQARDPAAAERFWSETLRGFVPPEPLTVGEPEPGGEDEPAGALEREARLPEAVTEALREAAKRHGASLNTLVQAAWAVLLGRYTGAADLVFGTTRTWRRSLDAEAGPVVGMFFNTVPVRATVDDAAPLAALLRELRGRAVAMREHEHTPLRRIAEWAGVPADVPLFDTVVNYDVTSVDSVLLAAGGPWERRRHRQIGDPNVAFGLTAYGEPGLRLDLVCDPRRVGAPAADRALGHVRALLEAIAADPERPVGELPLLAPGEREHLLAEASPAHPAHPEDACVHRRVEERAALAPGAPAVSGPGGTLTYGELDRRANRLAHHLLALGAGRESRVAVCVGRAHEPAVALLAVLKAGAAFVPLDPAYPAERTARLLEDSGARVVVTEAALREGLPAGGAETVCLDRDGAAIARRPETPPGVAVDPRELAYVVYTSGSTGRPKGVMVEHRSLLNLVRWHVEAFGVTAGDRAARTAGPAFDASVWELWPYLAAGASVHAADDELRASPAALRDWMVERGITVAFLPTPLAEEALRLEWPAEAPLRLLLTGGDRLRARPGPAHPFALVNAYGPTEGTVVATAGRVEPAAAAGAPPPSIGRAIGGARARVLDAGMRLLPRGVPGELYLGGAGVARGYLGEPALTAERFVPDPFAPGPGTRLYRTGDRVRLREDGALEFLGRTDRQVKVRGFRIEPAEVEAALRRHPGVADAVVVAREEPSGARRLAAYLVPAGAPPAAEEVRALAAAVLPRYMVPGAWVFLERLPLTPNGKLDRAALPAPGGAAGERGAPAAAASPAEALLAGIWEEVLGIGELGVHDNFFELGGDSILSIQVVVRAVQAGLQLTPKLLYQYPTVASLARVAAAGAAVEAEQGPVTGPVPLTPVQRWFLERDHPDPHHYDQSMFLLVWEGADARALETGIRRLAAHHDALRMRFARGPGGWEQENAAPGAEVPVTRVELGGLREGDRAAALGAAAGAAQASLGLAEGPLFRGVLFDLGAGRPGRLLLAAHHLVTDGVSWRILLEDLVGAHRQASHGEPVRFPPKTTSFREWAARLAEHAASPEAEAELPFWLAEHGAAPAPLPVDGARGPNPVAGARTVVAALEAPETSALLREAGRAYNTRIDDLLVAALARTFCAWTGGRTLLFDMEGHGREALLDGVDVSRTVGWFTSIYPVRVSLEGAAGPGEAIRAVKEQLRAVPRKGAGYGVLRHQHPDPSVRGRLAALPRAEVSFNYLGQFDQTFAASGLFERAPEPSGWSRSPRQRREYLLEVTARVTGGELRVTWTYGEGIHARATVEGLAERFVAELRALVAHCRAPEGAGFTPSDFPEAEIGSQEELDELLAVLALDDDPL